MTSVTHLGLDVHEDSISVSILRPGAVAAEDRRIENTPEALRKLVRGMKSKDLSACYEAGPTGYETFRLLKSMGIACDVVAPALIPRAPGRRVKTDRLDASSLARLHRAGELSSIRIPTLEEEALRDLIRLREDIKSDRRRAQQRLRSFLLRAGRRFSGDRGGTSWSDKFDEWVRRQRFDHPASQTTFDHLLAARDERTAQLKAIEQGIESSCLVPPLLEPVARLRSLRGMRTLTAATIVGEVCDFRRFPTARSFMAYTGLVPSEHSSGQKERRGSITKVGNAHVRRVLVESAWTYRHRPYVNKELEGRMKGQPQEVMAFSWRAQMRLHSRYRRLLDKGGSRKAVVGVARELSGFVWGLMNDKLD